VIASRPSISKIAAVKTNLSVSATQAMQNHIPPQHHISQQTTTAQIKSHLLWTEDDEFSTESG